MEPRTKKERTRLGKERGTGRGVLKGEKGCVALNIFEKVFIIILLALVSNEWRVDWSYWGILAK